MRTTSLEAYAFIKESGSLNKQNTKIYDILYNHGPLTAGEISVHMKDYAKLIPTSDRNIHARLSELRESTSIKETGTKKCSVTNRNCILWDVTEHFPKQFSKKEKIQKQIEITEKRLEKLKVKLFEELN